MAPNALVILAPGAEEIEVATAAALLRKAGISVTMAGLVGAGPTDTHCHVFISADVSLESVKDVAFDAIVLPGGLEGSANLAASPLVGHILRRHEASGALIAAICAAPTALKAHGIGLKKRITSHPIKAYELREHYSYSEDRVVIDGQLITSRAPGTAIEWALAIVENLVGKEKVQELKPFLLINTL